MKNFVQIYIIQVVIEQNMMKNRNFQEQEYTSKPMFQSGFISQFVPQRTTNPARDYSIDKNIRRMSPAPQERFSHVPNQVIYQMPAYTTNDYQMAPRVTEVYSNSEHSKTIQDLLMRIQKLQLKSQKINNLQAKIGQMQANVSRLDVKIQSLQHKKQDHHKGKQNSCASLENRMNQQDFNIKNRPDFVSKDQLQKHLVALDSAFKTHLNTFKTVLNSQMSEHNIKNKRKFIEITATQLNQKLQQFRTNFSKEWQSQLQITVKQVWNKQYVGKTAIGLSKQRFIGSVIPLKVRQQLTVTHQGNVKQVQKIQTLYYLDKNGYLLDKNMFYLLDKNNNQIRLADEKLEMMRKQGILSTNTKEPTFAKQKTLQTTNNT